MLKAFIFDFDYTLGDSTNGIVMSINYALEQLGCRTRSIEDIKKTIGLSLKETYFALTTNNDLNKADEFADFFKEKADEVMVDNTELYVGVKDVLTGTTTRENFSGYKCMYVGENIADVFNYILTWEAL